MQYTVGRCFMARNAQNRKYVVAVRKICACGGLLWDTQSCDPNTSLFLTGENEEGSLPRSMSVASGLNIMKRTKVRTIFPHTGNNKTLLSFQQGDIITLLLPEEKDGWLYGEHDTTKL